MAVHNHGSAGAAGHRETASDGTDRCREGSPPADTNNPLGDHSAIADPFSQTILNRIDYCDNQSFEICSFVIGLPGIYNGNRFVDAADYSV